jgi:hypothetical protein
LHGLNVAMLLFLIVFTAELVGVGQRAGAQPARTELRCDQEERRAVIGGKRVCLKAGQRCARRFESRYHRYNFRCHRGRLVDDPWVALRRPLRLLTVDPGEPCPRSTARRVSERYGPALGRGPVFLVGFGDEAIVDLSRSKEVGGWRYFKVIAIRIDGRTGDRALARGRSLDGANPLRFGRAIPPSIEGLYLFKRGDSANGPGSVRARAPGCYAIQLDTPRSQDIVVFEVKM